MKHSNYEIDHILETYINSIFIINLTPFRNYYLIIHLILTLKVVRN